MSDYNAIEKIAHRLALSSRQVADAVFDLEKASNRGVITNEPLRNGVFVTGLARAGTTILLRALYESGEFASLTYRDMPFVLAPNLWKRVARPFWKVGSSQQRAHGDRIANTADSPEALDEVFWRLIGTGTYIAEDYLNEYRPPSDEMNEFERYIGLINASQGKQRYLSKNNNTILRMTALRSRFADAVFVVPFRHPIEHAASLLEQHRRFLRLQANDPFVLKYMNWLGHHEFGLGHKRFKLGSQAFQSSDPNTISYWVEIWLRYYEHMAAEHFASPQVVPVCYEDLCHDPVVWSALVDRLKLPGTIATPDFEAARPHNIEAPIGIVESDAFDLYEQLRADYK